MAANNSVVSGDFLLRKVKLIVVQVLILIFFCINVLLILTFFKNKCFHVTTRYMLFALTLLSDSLLLFLSDILVIFFNFNITIHVWLCVIISVLVLLYTTVTPVTLTAMTLERYVAICMPLRHGELCSTRRTVYCILIIHGLSSVPCIVIFSIFFASASFSFYNQYHTCAVEMFSFEMWQSLLRSVIYQIQCLIMFCIIVVSYVKILKVAKAASGEDKKLTTKGLKTVVLHGFQLLLCLIQLWCPFIEVAVFNFSVYENIKYMNYLLFYLAPKCLSPLIYGIRDECFFMALKKYASLGLFKLNNI
ncbi:5-hydroxytryptamine receptor 2C [Channa argus]|uniref:5-hydroxytryptamine receptor 2C n=1 Tax=Channa argus TaxID=215402 RepID=A0A6G1PSB6_CHAAH|nr:5-hydroxytryptamine receptor 2C [Channa argus]